jgi:hypothetical protein
MIGVPHFGRNGRHFSGMSILSKRASARSRSVEYGSLSMSSAISGRLGQLMNNLLMLHI